MADNVTANGALIAADEVVDGTLGTVEVQYVKLMDGTLNGTGKSVIDSSGRLLTSVGATPMLEVTPADATATGALLTQDCQNYQSVKVQLVQVVTWVGVTVQFQISNDNTNWTSVALSNAATASGASLTSVSFTGQFYGNVHARYFRLNLSAITSGTVRAIVEFSPQSAAYHTMGASVSQIPTAAALADSAANPTAGSIDSRPSLFNGATWDRQRSNLTTTTGDTGAKTATFSGATQTNYNFTGLHVLLNLGTVSGTSPTLVAKLQGSPDGGTTWYDIPGATTASIAATGTYSITCYPGVTTVAGTAASGSVAAVSQPVPRTWRVAYTIGGGSPSFTITNAQVAYML